MNKGIKKIILYLTIAFIILTAAAAAAFQYSRPWQNALFIDPLYKISTNEKMVALTFDDGPSEIRTPPLLELLNRYDVKATFFMLGENIEKFPDIAKSVYEQGHLIGNHSYNHPRLVFKSASFISEQIIKTDELIKSAGQKKTDFFRPPYSAKFIILPVVLKSLNKKLVTCTYDPPSEYVVPYNAAIVAEDVINNTKPGTIIYLHDGKDSDQEQFIKSVELIIIGLKKRGYKFVGPDYID